MTLLDSSSMFSSFSIHTFQLNSNNNENSAYSPTLANSSSSSRACLACRMAHKSCDRAKPACSRCVSRGISHLCCEPSTKKRGRPRKWKDSAEQSTTATAQEQQLYEEEINSFSPQLVSNEVSNNERVVSPSNNSNSTTGTAFDMLNSATQVNSPIMYNAIPSNTCKSPVEEALLTETLKKTQSKKLKFIKIMNYNPNHRETFSPKFTITSQSQEKKHSISSPLPLENQPLQKKRKSKSTNPIVSSTNYQTSTVSQPISHQVNQFSIPAFSTSFVTSPTISQREVYTSNPISPPALYSYQTNPFQQQENETFQNTSPIYYPNSSSAAISTNQPRHCDEGRFVNNQVKLPSIYSLLSLQQE